MAISMQDVRNLFERYGWTYREQDERTLLVGFQGESNDFILSARFDDDWLSLTIFKYLPTLPKEQQAEVYHHLLELNSKVSFVRFALSSEGEIIITADLSGHKKLDYDLFAMAIDLLSFYADDAYPHLYKLITGGEPPKKGNNE